MPDESDAPGIKRRRRADGTDAVYWCAASVSTKAAAYPLKTIRLHGDEEQIAARCRILTAELREWLGGRGKRSAVFAGTIASLIDIYQRDEDSPYRSVKETTRNSYDYNLRILLKNVGSRRIDHLTRKDFAKWHREYIAPTVEGGEPRVRRAHGLMTMLRMLFGYGASMRFAGCRDAKEVLGEMNFPMPERRAEAITFAQAEALVNAALAAGNARSIGLGQALQFELGLRQIDVIGQWVRISSNTGGIVRRGRLWTGGITWADLTTDRLAMRTSKTGQEGQWNPNLCPLLVRAIAAYSDAERVGPAIINEHTGQPYSKKYYPKRWRRFADSVGIPKTVWNMDSRAGALTEAGESGAAPEDLRNFATHSSFTTTTRYLRRTLEATTRIAKLRVAYRQKNSENKP